MRLHPFRASGRTRESLQNGLVVVTHWDWAWRWSRMAFREEPDRLDPQSEFLSGKYASLHLPTISRALPYARNPTRLLLVSIRSIVNTSLVNASVTYAKAIYETRVTDHSVLGTISIMIT